MLIYTFATIKRETDTLSTLSQTLQSLRATNFQQAQTIARLETKSSDSDRQIALTIAQERSANATLRSAETRNRALREEVTRLKGSVAQIRAQCATDLRRRDGEIARLKRHLEGRRGRDGASHQVGVVVVTPGLNHKGQSHRMGQSDADLESPDYSLKQESTEFLTQLSQELSDENDALIGLVRGTLGTLRSLQGLPADAARGVETNGALDDVYDEQGVLTGPPCFEALASNTDEVLEHLRGLLTNPSFVPLEEVEVREEEIHRLREGWEMMAVRWKEAVALMGGWKKRMAKDGDTINLEDLQAGLRLGSGMPSAQEAHQSPVKMADGEKAAEDFETLLDPRDHLDQLPAEETEVDMTAESADLEEHATSQPLGERSPNAQTAPPLKKVVFSAIPEENTQAIQEQENADDFSLWDFSKEPQVSPVKPPSRIPLHVSPQSPWLRSRKDFMLTQLQIQNHQKPNSPAQTITQKLERAQKEAEDVRKREEKRTRRQSVAKQAVTKKLKGSRRRSTLSPEELENLMGAG